MPYGTGWHRKGSRTPSYCHSELVEESPAFPVAWRFLRQAQDRLFDRLRMCGVIARARTPYGTTTRGVDRRRRDGVGSHLGCWLLVVGCWALGVGRWALKNNTTALRGLAATCRFFWCSRGESWFGTSSIFPVTGSPRQHRIRRRFHLSDQGLGSLTGHAQITPLL